LTQGWRRGEGGRGRELGGEGLRARGKEKEKEERRGLCGRLRGPLLHSPSALAISSSTNEGSTLLSMKW
jgi:hypothetical protein